MNFGTVFIELILKDLGNTCFSVMMPRKMLTLRLASDWVAEALHLLDIPATVTPRHDISVNGYKVSGSAYRLTQNWAFHHGTMLIDTDLDNLRKSLLPPSATTHIEARGVQSVHSKVANLRSLSMTVDHTSVCRALSRVFLEKTANAADKSIVIDDIDGGVRFHKHTEYIDDEWCNDKPEITRNVQKWNEQEWTHAQTPDFTHTVSDLNLGKCQIKVHRGLIANVNDARLQNLLGQPYSSRLIDNALKRLKLSTKIAT